METSEAITMDYLKKRIHELMRLQKSRNTGIPFSKSRESTEDTVFQANRKQMGIDCEICGNMGHMLFRKDGHDFSKECACMTVYKNQLRIKKSGLSNAFTNYTFEKYKATNSWQKNIKNEALRFIEKDNKWFYIGGAVGSGKSHICTAICKELIKNKAVIYMPWRDEIMRIKASAANDEEYQKLVYPLKTVEVLYIDDFFKGTITQADINAAFEILNYRYNNCVTTIISSEYFIDEIIEKDEGVGSRIYHMAKDFCINVIKDPDKNYRLQ